MISLRGEQEIYTIKSDTIYAFGNSININKDEYIKLINSPNIIRSKNEKYGYGVCIDGIDFKFIFDYKDKQTVWVFEPGSNLPLDVSEYFILLTNKYKESINKQ